MDNAATHTRPTTSTAPTATPGADGPAAEPATTATDATPPTSVDDRPAPTDLVVGAATIAGPLLLLASSVAWLAEADAANAILLMWAFIGLGITIVGFSQRLRATLPWAAAVVLGIGIIGAAGGAGYAVEAAMVDHFGVERLNDQSTLATVLVLQLPGILYPLSFVVAAAAAWRARLLAPQHAAVLGIGALLFPASRIPDIAGLGVAADAVMCLALVPVGLALLTGRGRHATSR